MGFIQQDPTFFSQQVFTIIITLAIKEKKISTLFVYTWLF
jgi:hypothetical protein